MTYDLSFYHFMFDYSSIAAGVLAAIFFALLCVFTGAGQRFSIAASLLGGLIIMVIVGVTESKQVEKTYSQVSKYVEEAREIDAPLSEEVSRIQQAFTKVSQEGYFKTSGFVNPFDALRNPDVITLRKSAFLTKFQYLAVRDHIRECQINGSAWKDLKEMGGYPVSESRALNALNNRVLPNNACWREVTILQAMLSSSNI